jgi:hypothetical protein
MPWFYGPSGEKAIFSGPEDAIPEGWTSEPQFHPLDHDRDGKPGGSMKGSSRRDRRRRRGTLSLTPRQEGEIRGDIG